MTPAVIHIALTNEQTTLSLDRRRLRRAMRTVLKDAGISQAEISLAVVDDPTIHRLNRQYLKHDYATDVLSFVLEQSDDRLVGEVIVSADTAKAAAPAYGWAAENELLLYVVHGTLHLVGQEDASRAQRAEMRRREAIYLARLGLEPEPRPAAGRQRRAR